MYINFKARRQKRLRWLDDAENDVRELKLKTWMQKRKEREEWTCL
jgi:hypothetical protein